MRLTAFADTRLRLLLVPAADPTRRAILANVARTLDISARRA
jgi:hypothetical protein